MISEQDRWKVIDKFFTSHGLVKHQLDSFNYFLTHMIPDIIHDSNRNNDAVIINGNFYRVKFGDYFIEKPVFKDGRDDITELTPQIARIRNLTYSAPAFIKIVVEKCSIESGEVIQTFESTENFASIPIMVHSRYCRLFNLTDEELFAEGECIMDEGGYFIVNGGERTVVSQEKQTNNKLFYFIEKKKGEILSYTTEIRSRVYFMSKSPSLLSITIEGGEIFVQLPNVVNKVPLLVVFEALGAKNDKEIFDYILGGDFTDNDCVNVVRNSMGTKFRIGKGVDAALDYISSRKAGNAELSRADRIADARTLFLRDFLPHLSINGARTDVADEEERKRIFFGFMVKNLIEFSLGRFDASDRDHFANKRVDCVGPLFAQLFRQLFLHFRRDFCKIIKVNIEKKSQLVIKNCVYPKIISDGLKYALSTGNWCVQTNNTGAKAGVSQVLARLPYIATLSHLRKINTPIETKGKQNKPRQLHNTQYGYFCPAETPEGETCGLIKHLALTTITSIRCNNASVISLLQEDCSINLQKPSATGKGVKVFVDGSFIGLHSDIAFLYKYLKTLKLRRVLPYDVSISRNIAQKALYINCDEGRCMRPLFVVQNGEVLIKKEHVSLSWDEMMNEGLIEYVDSEEEEDSLFALNFDDITPQTTHMDLHPSLILGISASQIPFANHNQSPRNAYQASMGKQAMGMYTLNHHLRYDTLGHALYYPQRPLTKTKFDSVFKTNIAPNGLNAIVAVAVYTGFNQEDSMIMSQAAIDRGFFRSTFYRSYTATEDLQNNKDSAFTGTGLTKKGSLKVQDSGDGLAVPGTRISGGDVIIGKYSPSMKTDTSTLMRLHESGIVDSVMLTTNDKKERLASVKIRKIKIPEVGDKFASRHAQKATVGLTLAQQDLPFSREGVTPDMIINPHCLPSRMTIAQLIEATANKITALTGREIDATCFSEEMTPFEMFEALQEQSFCGSGNERMYNGYTGKLMENSIFIAPVFYQRLKHLVEDKIHYRARGPLQILTRAPVEGRSNDGGLKLGNMENDAIIANGASGFLKDRFLINSDPFRVHLCKSCGYFADYFPNSMTATCRNKGCKNPEFIQTVIPYAFKLLTQELNAMNVKMNFVV